MSEPPLRRVPRRAKALLHIAKNPGASNRQVAEAIGVADEGQASKLLKRIETLGMATNSSGGQEAGEPNSWCLTEVGRQIAMTIERAGEG